MKKKRLFDYNSQILQVSQLAAISVFDFIGKKNEIAADKAAVESMRQELNKINFNAEVKEIYNFYKVNLSLPFIDHVMKISPSKRIEKWFEENFIFFDRNRASCYSAKNTNTTKNYTHK